MIVRTLHSNWFAFGILSSRGHEATDVLFEIRHVVKYSMLTTEEDEWLAKIVRQNKRRPMSSLSNLQCKCFCASATKEPHNLYPSRKIKSRRAKWVGHGRDEITSS
jgi:hypothetical protein